MTAVAGFIAPLLGAVLPMMFMGGGQQQAAQAPAPPAPPPPEPEAAPEDAADLEAAKRRSLQRQSDRQQASLLQLEDEIPAANKKKKTLLAGYQ